MNICRFKRSLLAVSICVICSTTLPDKVFGAVSIDEIVVTARKREETLHDISAAISVVDTKRLTKEIINDVRDLQNIVPSLNVGEAVGIMKINMRGLGNSTVTRSEDSEVVIHEDGAVISRMEAQALAFFDLERVEVLRGPQGTLYGRNSTGGTINLITAKPTDEFSGYLNATAGDYSLIRVDGAVSGPLNDRVNGRLAFQSIDRDGYSKNRFDGKDFNDDQRWAVRGQLDFNISDNVELLLSAEYADQDDASGHLTYLDTLTGTPPPDPSIYSDPKSRNGNLSADPKMARETESYTATLNWKISDNFSIRNIANYRTLDFLNFAVLDVSSVPRADVRITMDDKQYSDELQLIYTGDSLKAMAGVFYFDEKLDGFQDVLVHVTSSAFRYFGETKTEVLSPFWNANYQLNDNITLRAGGRLNREDRDIYNALGIGALADGFSGLTPILIPPDANDDRSFNEYTGEYGIDYHLSEDTMIYYTFSQGYRAGAALMFQLNNPIIDPETVDSNEVGIKTQSSDHSFYANLALFDTTIHDLQRTQASINMGVLDTRINNIDEMSVKGAELEIGWSPVDSFRLNGTIVYIDAEFKDFLTDDPFDGQVLAIQVEGNRPRQTPKVKSNFTVEYDLTSTITAGVGWTYVGKQYFDEFNRAPLEEDSYSLFDASISYAATSNLNFTLWGKNLSDEDTIYDANFSAFGGIKNKFLINPRTWGLSARYDF